MNTFFILTGMVGIGCVGYAVKAALTPEPGFELPAHPNALPSDEELGNSIYTTNELTLAEASYLWTSNELDFRDIAHLWKEIDIPEPTQAIPRLDFKNEEIEAFYVEFVETRKVVKGPRKVIIGKLLKLLDDEGYCPSVVNKHADEAEGKLTPPVFKQLSSVSLRSHSLAVARKYASKLPGEVMLPDALIVALGHDIGKIPSFHDKYYHTATHPFISCQILKTMPEFNQLPNKDDIERIIRGHHLLKTDYHLTEALKLSDHSVRGDELAEIMQAQMKGQSVSPIVVPKPVPPPVGQPGLFETPAAAAPSAEASAAPETAEPPQPPPEEKPKRTRKKQQTPEEQTANPLGEGDGSGHKPGAFVPTTVPLPEWYNADAVVNHIARIINTIEKDPVSQKPVWGAVTGDKGIVWVSETGMWDALRKCGGGKDPEFLASEMDLAIKRNLVFTVVKDMEKRPNIIYPGLISPSYYQAPVILFTGAERQISSFLIPFWMEAFGVSKMDLENRRSALLKRMVTSVKAKAEENVECPVAQ